MDFGATTQRDAVKSLDDGPREVPDVVGGDVRRKMLEVRFQFLFVFTFRRHCFGGFVEYQASLVCKCDLLGACFFFRTHELRDFVRRYGGDVDRDTLQRLTRGDRARKRAPSRGCRQLSVESMPHDQRARLVICYVAPIRHAI